MTEGEVVRGRFGRHRLMPSELPQLSQALRSVPSWKGLLMTLGYVAGAAALCVGLLQTSLFAVERIDIQGAQRVSRDQLLADSGLKPGKLMVSVDESQIATRLQANPWVMAASVESSWPHVVKVVIKEREPVAIAQTSEKKWAQVAADGGVLGISDAQPSGLPAALGVEAPGRPGDRIEGQALDLMAVAAMLPESIKGHVTQMDKQNDVGIRLGLDYGTIVIVGSSSELASKLTSAAAVVAREDMHKIATLDVRSPESPLAIPKNVSTSSTKSSEITKEKPSTKPSTSSSIPTSTSVKKQL